MNQGFEEEIGEGEKDDGKDQFHLTFSGAPERTAATTATEQHAESEDESTQQTSDPNGTADEHIFSAEAGPFQSGKTENADNQAYGNRTADLPFSGHERVTEGTHEAETAALDDDTECQTTKQQASGAGERHRTIDPGNVERGNQHQRTDPGRVSFLADSRVRFRRSSGRALGQVFEFPVEIFQPKHSPEDQTCHHQQSAKGKRADG